MPYIYIFLRTFYNVYIFWVWCEQAYQTKLVKLDDNTFDYTLTIKECGGCEPLITSIHWAIISKLPDNVDLNFVVIRIWVFHRGAGQSRASPLLYSLFSPPNATFLIALSIINQTSRWFFLWFLHFYPPFNNNS